MRQMKFLIFLIIFIWLSGCTTAPKSPTQPEPSLKRLGDYFTISGKLGIRTSKEAHSAHFLWEQRAENYQIIISAPIGSGRIMIQGNDQRIDVQNHEDRWQSESPEELLTELFGLQIPISQLKNWIRGIPSIPHADATLNIENDSGWNVQLFDHTVKNYYVAPKKLFLEKGDIKLTLIIKEFENIEAESEKEDKN